MSTASIFGRSSKAMPGALTRLGPMKESGLTRSAHTGSISRLRPRVWIRKVACPTWVTRAPSPSKRAGGRSRNGLGKLAGHAAPAIAELPLQKRARPFGRDAVRIEEAHAVEMVRQRTLVVGVGARAAQQRPAACTDGGDTAQHLQKAAATGHRSSSRKVHLPLATKMRSLYNDRALARSNFRARLDKVLSNSLKLHHNDAWRLEDA